MKMTALHKTPTFEEILDSREPEVDVGGVIFYIDILYSKAQELAKRLEWGGGKEKQYGSGSVKESWGKAGALDGASYQWETGASDIVNGLRSYEREPVQTTGIEARVSIKIHAPKEGTEATRMEAMRGNVLNVIREIVDSNYEAVYVVISKVHTKGVSEIGGIHSMQLRPQLAETPAATEYL